MKSIDVKIDKNLSGRKIEYVLEKHLGISRTMISKLKRTESAILLNGKSEKVVTHVNETDKLTVNFPETGSSGIEKTEIPLDILFEDEDIIAVNKPYNMPVHPSKNHPSDTLANGLKFYLGENAGIHIITRLDRDTSGIVLVAKNPHSAKILTESIKKGNINKEYIAIVNGCPKCKTGIIDAPIDRDAGIKRKVSQSGKPALTEYEVIKNGEFSVVRLLPKTGRTHQIRVHLSYVGHPIYGDSMYGAPQKGERTRLHCHKISFVHPFTGNELVITAPLPEDMCHSELFGE